LDSEDVVELSSGGVCFTMMAEEKETAELCGKLAVQNVG
jgi:hypothetical protein